MRDWLRSLKWWFDPFREQETDGETTLESGVAEESPDDDAERDEPLYRDSDSRPAADDQESSETEALRYDPEVLENRVDVLDELGLPPEEFVVRLVEEQDGQVRQQAFTEYTDWSEATVSRVLADLEADGVVVRIQVGRENVVCLPEQARAHGGQEFTDIGDPPA